jgi:hypothetical protein
MAIVNKLMVVDLLCIQVVILTVLACRFTVCSELIDCELSVSTACDNMRADAV